LPLISPIITPRLPGNSSGPPANWQFFTLVFFTQCTSFSPSLTCSFYIGTFTEHVLSSGPFVNWYFFTSGFYTMYVFLPPYMRFLTRVFFTECVFPPAPPPTGSFLHLIFLHNAFFSPSLACVFYRRVFFTECVFFLRSPHQLVVFFTLCFLHNAIFSPSPACSFLHVSFFTDCVFSSGPPTNW
jgi:hypothetical protein